MVEVYNNRSVFIRNNQQNCPYCNPAPSADNDIFSRFFNSVGQNQGMSEYNAEPRNLMELLKEIFGLGQQNNVMPGGNPRKDSMIGSILNSTQNYDRLDNNRGVDGSIYNDPELSELLQMLDIADNNQKDRSIYELLNSMNNSTNPQQRQQSLNSVRNAHQNMLGTNYDALTKGTPGINNEKLEGLRIPQNKPGEISSADWAKIQKLDPQMQAAVSELYKRAGEQGISFNISSGLRTHAEQAATYAKYGPGRAARPGSSQHEFGRAIDIQAGKQDKVRLGQIWQGMGFKWGKDFGEDWHFDLRSR
ncbi:MAG: hypothetical protein A2Y25_07435 [Candidatus Melainabacteria bacterium GWF2_37_15]|nr:MAG: hypothetical protein A2Y25_07435 [Candidatus Melainabacteria bacterium GWF2_37_15]